MTATETTKAEADDLDLEMFNLSRRLQRLAEAVSDAAVDDASRIIYGLRGRVQKHMDPRRVAEIAS